MKTNDENLNFKETKIKAFFAYLELCNAINKVPEKIIYEWIIKINSDTDLQFITLLIENEQKEYLKEIKFDINNKLTHFFILKKWWIINFSSAFKNFKSEYLLF